MVMALAIEGYMPSYITYVSEGVEYTQTIGADYGVPIMVPKSAVEAVIYYQEAPAMAAMPANEAAPAPAVGILPTYGIFATFSVEDMPLAGIMIKNSGLCID